MRSILLCSVVFLNVIITTNGCISFSGGASSLADNDKDLSAQQQQAIVNTDKSTFAVTEEKAAAKSPPAQHGDTTVRSGGANLVHASTFPPTRTSSTSKPETQSAQLKKVEGGRPAASANRPPKSEEINLPELKLSKKFIETYLREFGYLRSQNGSAESKSAEGEQRLSAALKRFQEYVGVSSASGKMNLRTTELMLRKRCGNPDILPPGSLPRIWERSSLKWRLDMPSNGFPLNDTTQVHNMELRDFKELIRQAFSAWEIVISMEFNEAERGAKDVDITFRIENAVEPTSDNERTTGLGVASGTRPSESRVWIKRNDNWSTFQVQEENQLDIFLVLIHEIGHALGLEHSSDFNSIMYPIFERDFGEQLPVISNDDVERLRMLYGRERLMCTCGIFQSLEVLDPEEESNDAETNGDVPKAVNSDKHHVGPPLPDTPPPPPHCPDALWAATKASNRDIFIFMDVNCWRFNANRTLVDGPKPITEAFPGGPSYVDVAISADSLTVLVQKRTLYGFNVEPKSGQLRKVDGYPKLLHNRVLFTPEAAFPLANGSVILIKDNVFATYDLEANEPTMLNDKNVYFPDLPVGLRSGVLSGSGESDYWMMSADTVSHFDLFGHRVLNSQPLIEFLRCDDASGRMTRQRDDATDVSKRMGGSREPADAEEAAALAFLESHKIRPRVGGKWTRT